MNHQPTQPAVSTLWIEYHEIIPLRLVALFIQAEQEWLENAQGCYDVDAGEVWAMDIVPRLAANSLQAVDIDDLKRYVPDFLSTITLHDQPQNLTDDEIRTAISIDLGKV